MDTERRIPQQPARLLGNNGPVDGKFWFQTGLSLIVENPVAPPQYLENHEMECVPGDELQLGDVVVYYRGPLFYREVSGQQIVATNGLRLLRFGVAYPDGTDQIRVVSQDKNGDVWDHPIDELPGYKVDDDWDYYGLRLPPRQSDFRDTDGNLNPTQVIDTWLSNKSP